MISLIKQDTTPTSSPTTAPGGFAVRISELGFETFIHEAVIYSENSIAGDISANSNLPAAQVLTGSSASKNESLILAATYQPPDESFPALLPTNVILSFNLDNGGTAENPILTEISSS